MNLISCYHLSVDSKNVLKVEDSSGNMMWSETYNITWDKNGHGTSPTTPATYRYGIGVSSFPSLTASGYTFNGWYTASTGGTKVTSINSTTSGNKTYYAQWSAQQGIKETPNSISGYHVWKIVVTLAPDGKGGATVTKNGVSKEYGAGEHIIDSANQTGSGGLYSVIHTFGSCMTYYWA